MANYKANRVSEDIKREIAAMLLDLKDPRLGNMITIVHTDLSNDMSHCKVYISSYEGLSRAKEAVKGFESASGYIRRELADRLHIRKAPELKFIADDSIEHSAQINRILNDINEE